MSFISKRERVFVEDPSVELPSRQEGKLKAYASCTDARAWSHFNSDKTEHLVDIIKKNNEMCRNKYVPTQVIVDTLMCVKNTEIKRLKRKIDELENLVAAYDKLDLTSDQKDEIASAHHEIKMAYKELSDLNLNFDTLDLDVSNFTDGPDSDYFETGKSGGDDEVKQSRRIRSARSAGSGKQKVIKSHGDDWMNYKETKGNQVELASYSTDVSCACYDSRIDEMRENLITKDAKLSAMQNTLAVMENDICEPYCIYAHIYTALEKIFGTLSQNYKYRLYLDHLTSCKDTRNIDIKGRILFKLKILEKFSQALIAPCTEHLITEVNDEKNTFDVLHVETSFSITPSESPKPVLDSKRAHLVADIMGHEEMKVILSKENLTPERYVDASEPDALFDSYSIDAENLNRLKNLQADYEDLMTCYENLKLEKEEMRTKCDKYDELEKELQNLQHQQREYSSLWNEKEHFRRRSEDVDTLKEQYFVLSEETSNLETRLNAEIEINQIKSETVDELRNENISLEKKINDLVIAFEKEKNALQCKLKEKDCTVMCQEQQIRTLSVQIDRILEQDQDSPYEKESTARDVDVMDEIESLRDQIKNLKDALVSNEDEKQQLQDQFEEKLKLISALRLELEDRRSALEITLQRNDYLEKYTESFRDKVEKLLEENRHLSLEVDEKTIAVGNLMNVVNNKSQEVNKLIEEIDQNKKENERLFQQLQETRNLYDGDLKELELEKGRAMSSLQLARQESQELLNKVRRYEDYDDLKNILVNTIEENKRLHAALMTHESNNSLLQQELQRLRDINSHAFENINELQEEKHRYQLSLELTKKESIILEQKLTQFEGLREQLHQMSESQEKLMGEKTKLESELRNKANELDDAISSIQMSKKESEELLEKITNTENIKEDFIKLSRDYHRLVNEKQIIQKDLVERTKNLDNLLQALHETKDQNSRLLKKSRLVDDLEKELADLKKAYQDLVEERDILKSDFETKTHEINHLYNTLENKIDENRDLSNQIQTLEHHQLEARKSLVLLHDENSATQIALKSVKKESKELIDKMKFYENLSNEYNSLKNTHDQMRQEKERTQKELEKQLQKLIKMEQENKELANQTQNLIAHNEDLEKALITARNEFMKECPTQAPIADIIKEIDDMKKEKLINQKKIRDLHDKLDESENIISNMTEDVLARDDKIAILQNHINALEDEVRNLQNTLSQVVDTGEQLKDHSYQKIDQSLNKMEAHHSKAAHNMKMELAQLQNAKAMLEDKLTATKRKSDESFREKHKYVSQVIHLQNEREIIVTDIKQLEITAVGDSSLTPDNCNLEQVINSLEKIRKSFDDRISKSFNLEQTLLKVQTSSQLLLSKAGEAKKIVEVEKQKIINEKEDAVAEKMNLEKQLSDIKTQLEQQSFNDEKIIRDLKAEIQNRELIIENINKNTQIYTRQLEDEMRSCQNLYEKAMAEMNALQEKNKKLSDDNNKNISIINNINAQFAEKCNEIATLRKSLEQLSNKPLQNSGTQAGISNNDESVGSQTEKFIDAENNHITLGDIKHIKEVPENYTISTKKKTYPNQVTDVLGKHNPELVNEVQILTANIEANIEPTFESVRTSYIDYKIKRLSTGQTEQISLSCDNDTTDSLNVLDSNYFTLSTNESKTFKDTNSQRMSQFFDVDNRGSLNASSSKFNNHVDTHNVPLIQHKDVKCRGGSEEYRDSNGQIVTSDNEKDIFLIYQDSESSSADKKYNNNRWPRGTEVLAENKPNDLSEKRDNNKDHLTKDDRANNHHSRKISVDIALPRINTPSRSLGSLSDTDSKYVGSHSNENFYASAKEKFKKPVAKEAKHIQKSQTPFTQPRYKSVDSGNEVTNTVKRNKNKESTPRISRVEAFFVSVDNKNNPSIKRQQKESLSKQSTNDSHFRYRKRSHSEEIGSVKRSEESCSSRIKTSSFDNETTFSASLNTNTKVPSSTADQSVMVNIDESDYYAEKIKQLKMALQNVEKDYKKKIEVIKIQYDNNIQQIINEHNAGVKNIQSLHEETLQDIIKCHENETENLRTMSIEALRKVERLERENQALKTRALGNYEASTAKSSSPELLRKRKSKCRGEHKLLTKTDIEAFNVKPKMRSHGPCTCSLDVNISDTIRNIFEQVDVEQRKLAEHAYIKYIAKKITSGDIETLDAQELSFLHLKVCRTWKNKLSKDEVLQKKIENLETELMHKQRHAQQHIAELDRKLAEERRRLQEVREAVICQGSPGDARSLEEPFNTTTPLPPPPPPAVPEKESCNPCQCQSVLDMEVNERRSAGDLIQGMSATLRPRRSRNETNRATLARMDARERLVDERPTRLRRAHERGSPRAHKK